MSFEECQTSSKKISLRDMHEEGDGSIIERSMVELYEGTKEWISFSTSDEVQEEWNIQLKDDPISAIIDCYEVEQGFESISNVATLREFCEKNYFA